MLSTFKDPESGLLERDFLQSIGKIFFVDFFKIKIVHVIIHVAASTMFSIQKAFIQYLLNNNHIAKCL